jgi:hypothetical protein
VSAVLNVNEVCAVGTPASSRWQTFALNLIWSFGVRLILTLISLAGGPLLAISTSCCHHLAAFLARINRTFNSSFDASLRMRAGETQLNN